ncbi:unnamed protein product [Pylaiella littoralis]
MLSLGCVRYKIKSTLTVYVFDLLTPTNVYFELRCVRSTFPGIMPVWKCTVTYGKGPPG